MASDYLIPRQRRVDAVPYERLLTPDDRADLGRSIDRRSVALSLGLHAAIIALLLGWWRPETAPSLTLPRVTLLFQPGSAGAAGGGGATPGGSDASTQPAPESASAPAASAVTAKAAPAAPAAEPPQAALPQTPAPASPPQSPASQTAPAPLPPVAAPLVSQPSKPAPLPQQTADKSAPPAPRPQRKPRPPKHVAAMPPAPPEARAAPAQATPATVQTSPPQPAPSSASAPAAASPGATATTIAATGSPGSAPSGPGQGVAKDESGRGAFGNNPGAGDDWLDAARRRLLRFMMNPNEGRENPHYGTVWLSITVARDGRVLAASVDQSSGVPYLDAAALAMVHDASPLPPLPASVSAQSVTFKIPAKYEPGFFERLFR